MNNNAGFRSFSARLGSLIQSASLSPASPTYRDAFERLALELFALQREHNPPYRTICEALSVTSVGHWTQIPAVPAAAFKEFDLSCLSENERTAVFYSSGTTQARPGRHFHNADSLSIYDHSVRAGFKSSVLGRTARDWRVLILTPPPARAPRSSLVRMFDTLQAMLGGRSIFLADVSGSGDWVLDSESALSALESAQHDRRPVLIFGTAFSYVHLLDFLAARNVRLQLHADSIVLETGGYKGRSREIPKPEFHSLIARTFGLSPERIVCEYGMSELGSQAYDCKPGRIAGRTPRQFRFPPWAWTQVISPETGVEVPDGETGLLRIFDLANVYSVMAIQTEDLAIRRGDAFELLGRSQLAEPRGCSLLMR